MLFARPGKAGPEAFLMVEGAIAMGAPLFMRFLEAAPARPPSATIANTIV